MKIEKLTVRESQAQYIPRYKYKDYEKWEGRWELIGGHPYAMTPSPVFNHQVITGNIHIQLVNKLKNCFKCRAVQALDWIIDDENVVSPDNMVICYKPKGKFLTKPPAIIFEILSPATAVKDKEIKFHLYRSQKVKYYIIVDIVKQNADVFKLTGKAAYKKIISASNETVQFDVGWCKFDFDFASIWEL